MVRIATEAPPASPDEALHEIDRLFDELTRLAHSGMSARAFHGEVLARAVRALAAVAGAFWVPESDDALALESRVDQSGAALLEQLRECSGHRELLAATLGSGQPRLVLPGATLPDSAELSNPTDCLLLLCPIVVESAPTGIGIVEIAQRAGASPATEQSYLRLLAAFCDVAADFHRQRLVDLWRERANRTTEVERFSLEVHASLEVPPTAAAVANEGRRLLQWDRLSVFSLFPSGAQALAMSGQAEFDRRATAVRLLEELVHAVSAAGAPLWHGPEREPDNHRLAPQIAVPLEAYLDVSHVQSLVIVPLSDPDASENPSKARPRTRAALCGECFDAREFDAPFRERFELVRQIGGQALFNALDHEGVPLYPLWRAMRRLFGPARDRRFPRWLVGLGLVTAAGLALAFVPADLEISGRGVLQPEIRRDVFAAADGVVADVRVDHGAACQVGETLVVLTRSQLDFEFSRVLGEMQTARKRLAGVAAARLDTTPRTAAERDRSNQLTAEEEELRALLANLEEQQSVLKRQQEELVARSPIDGQVITWNVRDLLDGRPVQKGQVLLTVADLQGPWILEVEVPDDQIGHVLEARSALRADLDVEFLLATAPDSTYHGRIRDVSLTTNVNPSEPAHVRVTVGFDRTSVPQLRPGATVVPRIRCGTRSLGYVLFHGLIEAVQKHFWF